MGLLQGLIDPDVAGVDAIVAADGFVEAVSVGVAWGIYKDKLLIVSLLKGVVDELCEGGQLGGA